MKSSENLHTEIRCFTFAMAKLLIHRYKLAQQPKGEFRRAHIWLNAVFIRIYDV